ncbi:MAG: 1-acyl-sn-glycerol-3-phosphate acyltransferase [Muribaculum sp.]|nr:1-acyl-sn-glycerol-3-phosphate acyltransferase [Muribaculum sp.]
MNPDKDEKTIDALKVDVEAVISDRLPTYSKFIPKPLIQWLKSTICQDDLNGILERTRGKTGAEFCGAVLKDLNVSYSFKGQRPDATDQRVLIVCNHPLGGLDGIAMIHWASTVYGTEMHFVVNDLLSAVKPLSDIFLPINKHGKQSRKATLDIDECMAGDKPVIMFPAGMVSRKQKEGIKDLKWQKMFINKAIQFKRNIIPVYFDGENSSFFYNFAKFRTWTGLKFNIEMVYLPREIFRSRDSQFTIVAGKPIPWNKLKGGHSALLEAKAVKKIVYNLKDELDKQDNFDEG